MTNALGVAGSGSRYFVWQAAHAATSSTIPASMAGLSEASAASIIASTFAMAFVANNATSFLLPTGPESLDSEELLPDRDIAVPHVAQGIGLQQFRDSPGIAADRLHGRVMIIDRGDRDNLRHERNSPPGRHDEYPCYTVLHEGAPFHLVERGRDPTRRQQLTRI